TLGGFVDDSLKVTDPAKVVTNLTGTVDVTDNDAVTSWIAQQLLKVMRTEVTTEIVRNGWPILGLSAYTPQLEQTVVTAGNAQLVDYGLSLVRTGNADVTLSDDDEAPLTAPAKHTAHPRRGGGRAQRGDGRRLCLVRRSRRPRRGQVLPLVWLVPGAGERGLRGVRGRERGWVAVLLGLWRGADRGRGVNRGARFARRLGGW